MSHGLDIEWINATTARIVNRSSYRLRQVRAIAIGGARIAGRRQWIQDVEDFRPGDSIRLVRIQARTTRPAILIRFHVAHRGEIGRFSPWRTDELPLTPPGRKGPEPWVTG